AVAKPRPDRLAQRPPPEPGETDVAFAQPNDVLRDPREQDVPVACIRLRRSIVAGTKNDVTVGRGRGVVSPVGRPGRPRGSQIPADDDTVALGSSVQPILDRKSTRLNSSHAN